jgi:replicative DNA helicase
MKPEHVILRNLCGNEDFSRKVLPYFKDEYFTDPTDLILFRIIRDHITEYSEPPSRDVLQVEVPMVTGYTDEIIRKSYELIATLESVPVNTNTPWLHEFSEKFCQDRALYNAVQQSIEIFQGKVKDKNRGVLPELFREALGVSFDSHIGHNYFEDWEARFDKRHETTARIPFDINMLNVVTNGGLPGKSLSIITGGTNVGKTLCMCSLAAGHLAIGYDVLYITLEMSDEMIAERIDANALNIGMDGLLHVKKDEFKGKIESLRRKTMGKLVIKEYPNLTASSATFRNLISEISLKERFKPQVVYVDYMNLVASARVAIKGTPHDQYVAHVAGELRALAQQENIPIISATQFNRAGFADSDPDMDQVAASFSSNFGIDFMIAITSNDDLAKLGQYVVKQLKSRFGNKNKHRSFVIGVDYDKQRLFDVDDSAHENVGMKDITPEPDPAKSPQAMLMARKPKPKFTGFKS